MGKRLQNDPALRITTFSPALGGTLFFFDFAIIYLSENLKFPESFGNFYIMFV